MKSSRYSLAAAIAWFLMTTLLLMIPGTRFPKQNWFDKIGLDKWVHIGLFSVLVWLWCRVVFFFSKKKKNTIEWFILFSFLFFVYGIGMEFIQKNFIPNRSFDNGDIIADGLGCVIGFLFCFYRYKKNRPL